MNIAEFHNALMKLMPSEYSDKDFREHLRTILNEYKKLLLELDKDARPEDWDSIVLSVNSSVQTINEIIRYYYDGQHSKAYMMLKGLMINKVPKIAMIMPEGQKYYRMRVMDSKKELSHKELFHIPFDKRGIVKTQRYSMPGLPCLYISDSVYGCWEEMGRPNLNQCYVSQLESQERLCLVDLTCPFLEDWLDAYGGKHRLHDVLPRIPIIIASMVKVKNDNDVFKPEYIIPQLIMEMVVNRNNKERGLQTIGVYYTSVHNSDDLHFAPHDMRNKMNNIAVPPQSTLRGKYCKILCNKFTITDPTCDELEQAKTAGYQVSVKTGNLDQQNYPYANSVFGQLEKRLSNRNLFPLHKVKSQ